MHWAAQRNHCCSPANQIALQSKYNTLIYDSHPYTWLYSPTPQVTGQWMTKLEALLRRLLLLQRTAPQEKSLVFSQWPDALRLLSKALDVNKIRHVSLAGVGGGRAHGGGGREGTRRAINAFERDDSVRVFLLALKSSGCRGRLSVGRCAQSVGLCTDHRGRVTSRSPARLSPPSTHTPHNTRSGGAGLALVRASDMFLLQTPPPTPYHRTYTCTCTAPCPPPTRKHTAGAAGLTLVRANHVFLLEPALDPAIEQQAVARVHRIGQTRPVTITRLLVAGSVEEEVAAALERKQALLGGEAGGGGGVRRLGGGADGEGEGEGEEGDGEAEGEATGLAVLAPKAEMVVQEEVEAMLARLVQARR